MALKEIKSMLLHSDLINTQIVHMHLTEKFGMLPATRNFGIVRIPEMLDALSTKDKNEVHCSNPCRIPLLQIPPPDSPPHSSPRSRQKPSQLQQSPPMAPPAFQGTLVLWQFLLFSSLSDNGCFLLSSLLLKHPCALQTPGTLQTL